MAIVTLIAYTPNPEKVVAAAAKLCYSQSGVEKLMEDLTPEKTTDFLDMLSQIGHESPIEHVNFTFGVEGVSRVLLAQITRHRIASYSVQSQRYVNKSGFECIVPPAITESSEALKEFENSVAQANDAYNKLTEILTQENKDKLVSQGIDEELALKKARKLANEDARFVLPNACDTKMVVTMNARSLLNFLRHRLCSRAQWEIRAVALEMYKLAYTAAPALFERGGPPCIARQCPEGKMSCGKSREIRNEYAELRKSLINVHDFVKGQMGELI